MTTRENETTVTLDKLSQYAVKAAAELKTGRMISTIITANNAEKDLILIKSVMRNAAAYAEAHVTIPQEVEWLLDNWYIAEREGKCAVSDIKTTHKIQCITNKKKRLVVSEAARTLIISGCGAVCAERIEVFLDAFQDVICFSEAELTAFIPALRLELISFLAEACRKLRRVMQEGVVEDGLALLLGRYFTSLRFLSGFDASKILENINRVERTLRLDPVGVYAAMDEQTRYTYRHEIARLAATKKVSAHDVANKTLELARENNKHVGYYIYTKPLGCEKKKRTGSCYIGFIILSSLFVSLLISFALDNPAISLLLLLPVSEFIKNLTDYYILRVVRPQRIPRLELACGVPEDGKTLCVISILLSSTESGARAAGLLEEYRLSNRDAGKYLQFGILADLPDATEETVPDDKKYLSSVNAVITRLNTIYGGGFFLFCRGRRFNARDNKYTPWERKRGAILELCRYLKDKPSKLQCLSGNAETLSDTKFMITLDSDTRLCAGTAIELIGAALHPLNRAVVDTAKGVVTTGSGIIQPRISVDLAAACQTNYTRIFAGQGGIDPYGGMTGDIYQNLFGTGSFAGKGIIDIAAYLICLDHRFPENTVLSHDLLEGAYLRCIYAGDIELTDGYPAKVTTYYDRMHRWTRGDWQLMPWLFNKVRTEDNSFSKNALSQIDRWKIADNFRRSLVSVFTLAALISGMLFDNIDLLWAAVVAVLSAISHLVITSAAGVFNRNHRRVRYQSTVISGLGGQFLQTIIKLILLPYEALVSASAVATALFRMLFTRRHMLEWVTAADSEKKTKNTVVQVLIKLWPSVALSLFVAALSPYTVAFIVGVLWALSPLLIMALGRDSKRKQKPDQQETLLLSRCAGDIWHYFDELMTADDHYLPPDNYQEQPAVGIAHRTSPTNIGLGLLSALAALDLGVCTKQRALELISHLLDTIEILPKWNGHLYNWYDTQTLGILQPSYISTVDSGNFAGCLIALREGLLELGETALAQKAHGYLSAMSFTPMFDEQRQLFYIGWDLTKGAPTEGWYDLLSSEARQTSYLAIARGDIPRKHWKRLGRSLVAKDGFRGMASWTGTMFEYMMPELLLPCFENSLIYESLKFCLYVQKKRASGFPWGMSESAFYAFDHTLSYRYKAHGVQRLALKRGMGREAVVSPYSTFLALQVDLKESIRNLQQLQKLGMEGRYGLYEAVDFTPNRLRNSKYEIVKTFMAHHIGMSLVAIDNVLKSGIMQRRFMRDRSMASFAELLQEKVPLGGIILRQPPRDVPEKPLRLASKQWAIELSAVDYLNPRCTLLGNGAYTVVAAETGQSSSLWNGVTLTKTSSEALGTDTGMSFFLNCSSEIISLLPAPLFDKKVRYSSVLTGAYCCVNAKSGSLSTSMTVSVPENDAGELRVVEIISTVLREAELICYFEPVLSRQSDYESHPAFSKLSLETSICDGSVIVKRRPRSKGRGIALAFDCDCPFAFDTSRESALGRGGLFALKSALLKSPSGTLGGVLDPCVFIRVKLQLKPDIPCRVSFSLTTSSTPQAASAAAKRILSIESPPVYSRLDEAASRLGLSVEKIEHAMGLLPELLYHSPGRLISSDDQEFLRRGQSSLWSLGISGDLPILASVVEDDTDVAPAAELIPLYQLLTENGVNVDLVYLLKGGGDYRSTLRDSMLEELKAKDIEFRLGARGGIHLADLSSEGADMVRATAVRLVTSKSPLGSAARRDDISPVERPLLGSCPAQELSSWYNDDNSFSFNVQGKLPYNAWSHMLANETFGYLATDAGTGHMWHLNARENKINRWLNDSLLTEGTETLQLRTEDSTVSLFAENDGYACTVTYGFGWATWKKNIREVTFTTTAFVPPDIAARVFIIEADSDADFDVAYSTDLLLSANPESCVYVSTAHTNRSISAQNLYNTDFPDSIFYLVASSEAKAFTCSKSSLLTGAYDGQTGLGFIPCAAAVYGAKGRLVIVTGCGDEEKLQAVSEVTLATEKLKETMAYWHRMTSKISIKTPSENLNRYFNGWATYQALACRVFGRSSLYQSGGAYGFRDQLQDVCALVDEAPEVVRAHLLRAAAHQFQEGDVQHWWHPGYKSEKLGDKGVRTRCSDDLLWLPYALCDYVEKTGDTSIWAETAPFIFSTPLSEDEDERYEQPKISEVTQSLLEHAIRAVDLVNLRGTGRHGLSLIGSGDWNDGMNLVGAGGEGESVWLTWFMCVTALKMASACLEMGNPGAASRFTDAASQLKQAAEYAWDGDWYMRGYFDDGSPLGSCSSEECRIDSIAQSFAALAEADAEKTQTALFSSVNKLFDRDERIVRLFDPPFSNGSSTPGYIKGYSPGFRENGGQYTHGAIWLAMGLFLSKAVDKGWEVLEALLPQNRPNDIYKTEPYVLAADVYSAPGHVGRGGWTWYTGAAGWFKRVTQENFLGITLINGVLHVRPLLPSGWDGFEAEWSNNGTTYHISVKKDCSASVTISGKEPSQSFVVVDAPDSETMNSYLLETSQ